MTNKETTYGRKDGPLFSHYCDSWLDAGSLRLKASSCAKYSAALRNHIVPFWGDYQPDQIVSEDVTAFTRMLLDEKRLAPKTVRDLLALFHAVFSYAQKREEQKFKSPDVVYPRNPKRQVRVLDAKEETVLYALLANGMDSCKFGAYLALRTGMRIGEICALRWCDISFESRTISVSHTVQRIPCQNPEDKEKTKLIIGLPKSESSRRLIPLMPDIAALCSRFPTKKPDAYVLTGTADCMDPRKLQRRLKQYVDACGIDGVHFHTLRHTFATRCVEAGFDVKTLSEILGHSSISITMDQYVHPNMDLKRENMSRLKPAIPLSV